MDNKKTLNKSAALILAVLFCLTVFSGFAPVYGSDKGFKPCTGTEHHVTMIRIPTDNNDPVQNNWGHVAMDFANGWDKGESIWTTLRVMNDRLLPGGEKQIGYCIEPGVSQHGSTSYNEYDEIAQYWDDYVPRNGGLLDKRQVCKMLGRLMYFGYQGTVKSSWKSTNTNQADKLAWAYATQLLIWEVIVGERDIDFIHRSQRTATTVPAPPTPEPTPSPTPTFTVTWKNWDGKVLETDKNVPYGTMPEYNGSTPKRDGWNFVGWNPTPVAVTADATYTATFSQGGGIQSVDSPAPAGLNAEETEAPTPAPEPAPTPEPVQEKEPQSGIMANPIYDMIDLVYSQHPLYAQVIAHYNEMVTAMQNHLERPSFMKDRLSEAQTQTLEWNSAAGRYQAVLTDVNNVLGKFTFQAYNPDNTVNTDVHCDISGNALTVWSSVLITGTVAIEADRKNSHRLGVITWDHETEQDSVTFGQEIDDPVQGFLNINAASGEGSVKIIKTSEDGNVAGITFTVTGENVNETVTTDENGEILIPNLLPGTYTVTETVPLWYEPQQPQTVNVTANETAIVSFHNVRKRGTLKIIKTSEDGNVEGISFTVESSTGSMKPKTVTTGADGIIEIPDLLPETYTVTETVPAGYEPQPPQTVTVVANETATVTFHNVLKRGDGLRIIKTSEDGNVANITFTVTGEDFNETVTTDANGEIFIPNLLPGTYTVTEQTPNEYEPQPPQTVTVIANETATVTFHNVLRYGTLKIIKTSEDGNVAGITFTVTGENVSETVTTDANGEIFIPDLLPGTYTVTEQTPDEYEPQQPQTVTVVAGETATVEFHNVLKPEPVPEVLIKKTSDDNNVANITFRIEVWHRRIQGTPIADFTRKTDINGEIRFSKYPLSGSGSGSVQQFAPLAINDVLRITEIVPDGYIPGQENPQIVKITEIKTYTVNFHNEIQSFGSLKIIKTSEDGNVEGISFEITSKPDYYAIVETDKNGEITLNLQPGTYTIHEIVPEGYMPQPDQTVTVVTGKTATVSFYNVLKRGCFEIVKTSEDGKTSGISFKITGDTDCGIAFEPITVTTGSDGKVLVTNLLPGKYNVHEIVPEGYIPQPDQTVTVTGDEIPPGNTSPQSKPPQSKPPLNTSSDIKTGANSFPFLYCRESDTRSAFCASQNGAFFYNEKRKNKSQKENMLI